MVVYLMVVVCSRFTSRTLGLLLCSCTPITSDASTADGKFFSPLALIEAFTL